MSEGNNRPPSSRGGPRSAEGRRRSSRNATRSGIFSVTGSGVPAVKFCPLKGTDRCGCPEAAIQDGHVECPTFAALRDRLIGTYLREPHIRGMVSSWRRVRDLVTLEVKAEVYDAFTARTGPVRPTPKGLDFHAGEAARGAIQNEIRRLAAELLLTPASRRMARLGGAEPFDLAARLAALPPHEEAKE